MAENIVLQIKNVTKKFPGVTALNNVSFSVEKGTIHALMGENGAGKSTLIQIISGAISATSGSVVIDGVEKEKLTPALSSSLGVGVIYQELNNVPSLSVAENVFLGKKVSNSIFADQKLMQKKASEIFKKLGVDIPVDVMVSQLSIAQQQIVEIAKALSQNVKILIMDEPTTSLALAEVERLLKIVRNLKEEGVTIIYISHRIDEVLGIADNLTVLRDGHHIETCPMEGLTRRDIIKLMVGRDLSETYPERTSEIGEPILQVENLTGNGTFNISFDLRKGEILGFAGLIGAGRTELARVIYGDARKTSGKIIYQGKEVDFKSPKEALNAGIGYISENRKTEGVFLNYPVDWNITIAALRKYSKAGFVQNKEIDRLSSEMIERFKIKTPNKEQLLLNLSGGNQQKVALSKVIALSTNIIIFDEPTKGIDVGVKQEIYKLMNELVASGISIIMISSEMEELLGMSDRVVVLHEGHKMGEVLRKDFNQNKILELASGIVE